MKVTRFLQKIFEPIKSGLNFLAIGLILYVGTTYLSSFSSVEFSIGVFLFLGCTQLQAAS